MDLNKILSSAQNAHQKGNFPLAKQLYHTVIKLSNDVDALYGLATLLMQEQQFSSAIPLFEQALTIEPHAVDISFNFVLCLKSNKNNSRAIAIIHAAKTHLPDDQHLNLAFAYQCIALQQPSLAIEIIERYQYDNPEAKSLIAEAYMQLNDWLNALNYWQQLTTSTKTLTTISPISWQKLALCAAKLRRYPTAIQAYANFISHSPKNSINHLKFIDLLLLNKELEKAKQQLAIVIQLKDQSLLRYETEANIYRLLNQSELALKAAKYALKIDAYSAIAWQIIQEFDQLSNSDVEPLQQLLAHVQQGNFTEQKNAYTLAKHFQQQHNYTQAFKWFKQANDWQHQHLIDNNLMYKQREQASYFQWLTQIAAQKKTIFKQATKHIFIVGMPRSGTTLVERLLTQQANVKSCGESEALAFEIEPILKTNRQNKNFNLSDHCRENAIKIRQNYLNFIDLNSDISIDKMPHNFRYVSAILALFPEAKIIQLRRNAEDLALSIYCQHFADSHNYSCQLTDIAHAIFQANKLMDFWLQQYPDNVIDVDYQQLVTKPEQVSKNIFEFCQLNWQSNFLDFYQENVASFTFSELQVRKPINTSKINYWQNYRAELASFCQAYQKFSE